MESGEKFDVIIVGAGPGGSALAAFLGKEGRKVLLLEKSQFPRDKTCGDAVGGKCTKILRELGISADMEKNPHAKISGVVFSNPKGTHVTIPFPKNKEGKQNTGYVCRRYIYDNFLFENVKKYPSVKVIQNFTVADVIREGDSVVGVKGAGQDRAEKSF
ncbi:FAD-binding protein, partial [Candidatus Parvarchaeota archaeon]|nr:FAD-binding protein [Candidatus Parvarchaeota archaeon]